MTTANLGNPGIPVFVAFSGLGNGLEDLTDTIDLSNAVGEVVNFAFSMPRNGFITSVTGFFSSAETTAIPSTTITVHARIYASAIPNNVFTAIAGTEIALAPALGPNITVGDVASGAINGLMIPITAQTRIMMVFFATAEGETLANTTIGYVSGGIGIL